MSQDTPQTSTPQASTWGRLATTAVAHMAEHLYVGVIAVVLPVMTTSLGLSMAQAGTLVSARYLVAGLSNIPSGILADTTGRRSIFLGLSLIVIGLSSLLMSFAPGFWMLVALMAFGGIGAGSFHPQSLAILSAAYRERRALALGVHDSAGNFGEVIAPLTIGILLTFVDWRNTLQIWAIPGLTIGLLYALFCAEVNPSTVSRGGLTRSLRDHIVTNRAVLGMFVISVFRTMGQTALLAFLPLYLALDIQLPVGVVGFYMSTLLFFAALAPTFSGWLSDRIGRAPMLIAGTALSAISIGVIPYLPPGVPLGAGCAVVGIVLWALRPVIFAAAMEAAPSELAGTLVGFLFTGNMGISFLAPIIAGLVADAYGLAIALAFVGIFPLLACIATLVHLVTARAP